MSRTADALVIGGGVIGSAVFYYLSKEGVRAALVERGDICSGTSGACDGNILSIDKEPGYDSQLALLSQRLLRELVAELDCDVDYTQRGSVLVVEPDARQEAMARDWMRRQKEAGLPMRYIEGREVFKSEPLLARDVIGLVECASDSSLSPLALTFGLVEAAKRLGGAVYPRTEIRELLRDRAGSIRGARSSTEEFAAPRVILAAGVWTPHLAGTVGLDVPIQPRKGHILVGERTPDLGRRKLQEFGYLMAKFGQKGVRGVEPAMEESGVAMVYEPTGHGNFLIGSSRQFVGFDTQCDLEVLRLLAKRALRFFPSLRNMKVIHSYAGLRPWTPDHYPIVSAVASIPGLYIAAGHEGDGIGLAPITGRLLSEMITGRMTAMSVDPLRLERFDDGAEKSASH
ncbi:MAG: FAD-dependent oxidoreductase [Candidatus Bipolaricaulis sp.]|nr:FAD-dependent oxidoreductase [Candidatus Bipolaricaulis sp.]MDD5646569.1 FAD-dependent oxidoreductase [Candidatus Bipolaricaulis sp.]